MDKKELVYFIPDLFKPKNEHPSADDPFICKENLQKHCSIFNSQKKLEKHELDVITYLGQEMFDEAKKIHNKREVELYAEDAAKEKFREEKLQDERAAKKILDEKVAKMFKQVWSCVKRSCPVKIPYKSCLNHDEHALYLTAFLKYQKKAPRNNSLEEQEYQHYLSLQNRVFEEQKLLMEFSQTVAKLQLKEYNNVPKVMKDYVTRYTQHRYKRVLSYPALYHMEQEIPLVPQDLNNMYAGLTMEHQGHLLSLGMVPYIMLPYPNRIVQLPNDEQFLEKHPPEAIPQPANKRARIIAQGKKYLNKCSVSDDPNCEYLAQQHRATVVLSPTVLKTLLDNPAPNFDKEWDIPVTVKSYQVTEADGTVAEHRVTFIDKPIKRKIFTPLEEKTLFYKKSGLTSITRRKVHPPIFRMKTPKLFTPEGVRSAGKRDRDVTAYENPFDYSEQAPEEETSTSDETETLNKRKKSRRNSEVFLKEETNDDDNKQESTDTKQSRKTKQESTHGKVSRHSSQDSSSSTADDSCSGDMLDNLLNKQTQMFTNTESNAPKVLCKSRRIGEEETIIDPCKEFSLKPWSKRLDTDWSKHDNPLTPPPDTTVNYHYQLYKLHVPTKAHQASVSGKSLPPVSILVRHHLHGLSLEYSKSQGDVPKSCAYVVSPKMENQGFFGCEVNTHAEIVHQFAELLVRPNTYILQLRICSASGQVMLGEERDLPEVLREGHQPHIRFQPHASLTSLYCTLNILQRLAPGHYLLHHHNKSEAFIRLMKSIDQHELHLGHHTTFNLHASYGYSSTPSDSSTSPDSSVLQRLQYTQAPWLPIDTQVPTPFHLVHKKIPGTFPMANPNPLYKLPSSVKKKRKNKAKNKMSMFDDPEQTNKTETQADDSS